MGTALDIPQLFNEYKEFILFAGGVVTGLLSHAYKGYKLWVERQDQKDAVYEELVQITHENRSLVMEVRNKVSEIEARIIDAGVLMGGFQKIDADLKRAKREILKPAYDAAHELYKVATESRQCSLKVLKEYRVKAKALRHTNELSVAGVEARLKEIAIGLRRYGA